MDIYGILHPLQTRSRDGITFLCLCAAPAALLLSTSFRIREGDTRPDKIHDITCMCEPYTDLLFFYIIYSLGLPLSITVIVVNIEQLVFLMPFTLDKKASITSSVSICLDPPLKTFSTCAVASSLSRLSLWLPNRW